MTDIYDEAKAVAIEMLAPRSNGGMGLELTLTRVTKGEYDPDTGSSPVTTDLFEGSGFRENYRNSDIDGSRIKQGDVKILVSPVQLTGADMPTPITLDKILFDGDTYTVQNVEPWNYAGLNVGFSVQARK
jgi:hypothetical protein